jgi:hypothetical protein
MANSDKNVLITPNTGSSGSFPTIQFTGAGNIPTYLRVLDDGTVSFESTAGQLFSISDGFTGTIFSVNDISGIPSIEVLDTGTVRIAQYGGNVGIGIASPTQKLSVSGAISATAQIITTQSTGTSPLAVSSTTMVANLNADLWDGFQSSTRSDWSTNGVISLVVGQLAWKNYGNGHTIFDASNGTSPDGIAISNTDSGAAWTGSYPTLMGWNGSTSYGVRVDSSRMADVESKRVAITSPGVRNITLSTGDPSGGTSGDVWLKYTA